MKNFCYLILKKNYNKKINIQKGSALLIVIIVMMLTFIMAAFILDASIKNNKQADDVIDSTKAYYSAETGVYDFIYYINNHNAVPIGTKITNLYNIGGLYADNMSAYDVEVKKFDNNSKTYTIYSHGSYGSQDYIIVAEVSLGSGTSYYITKKTVYKD
ncbi:MAG: hypothetical protein ABF633_15355 [Clostridium sp.]|uniref:hypothetical protein n=1 Tax=Clostridium sp. TaxID=1506 RepID=UPI0039EA91ED